MTEPKTITNREFAGNNKKFRTCCEIAGKGVGSTVRQASKFRNKQGKAYQVILDGRYVESS